MPRWPSRTVRQGSAIVLAALLGALGVSAAPAGAAQGGAIPGHYIVRLQKGVDRPAFLARYGITPQFRYGTAVNGFSARLTSAALDRVRQDARVMAVDPDAVVKGAVDQLNPPSWGLDRLDQLDRPLDSRYRYVGTGLGVTVYVVDSGIRTDHVEFGGRAVAGKKAFDAVGDGYNGQDCFGHGTHVAGTIGGATVGVAKQVKLVSVRVLDCTNAGTVSGVLAGVDWVAAHAVKPAVVNMSLDGEAMNNVTDILDDAIKNAITYQGLPFVVAAGNAIPTSSGPEVQDACDRTPAHIPEAITVGATDENDVRAAFSNVGSCIDEYAPGANITSAGIASSSATAVLSGTSMSTALVTGLAAQFVGRVKNALPVQVAGVLQTSAIPGYVVDPLTNAPVPGPTDLLATKFTGHLAGTGATEVEPYGFWFNANEGYQRIFLAGEGTDFNVRVFTGDFAYDGAGHPYLINPVLVAQSTAKGSNDTLVFRGGGTLYAEVVSAKGSGDYELWWQQP